MLAAAPDPAALEQVRAEAGPARVAELWRDFAGPLRAFLRSRVRNEADADDLLQTVFLKIQRGVAGLRDAARLQGWVFRIARHALADHHRRGPREEPTADLPELAEALEGEELVDLRPAVRRMIGMLSPEFREAIVLTEFDGLTQAQLAARLGISVSGAKSRVQRARAELRRFMDECCRFEFDRRGRVIEATARQAKCSC